MALHGERLDKPTYTVLQTIKDQGGSTGVCYKGFHEIFRRDVAQKTVSLLGLDDAVAYSEPELLKSLRHKHLIEVWEAQWDPDPHWKQLKAVTFVMPFYEGGSILEALLDEHRFSIGEAIGVACGLLDALHYLHIDRRILHRDVKPSNVLLDATRTHPYLGDLGSAAPMSETGDTDVRVGTPLYLPPEAHLGRHAVRGDIYAVGMVLLECLNGSLPYGRLNLAQVETRLAEGRSPVPARLLRPAPHVPPSVTRLVSRLVSADPVRRPETAVVAQRALERATHMDWRPNVDDDSQVWDGRQLPTVPAGRGRLCQVRAQPILRGRYAGAILLTARWRRAGTTTWRQFRSLERHVPPGDDAALAGFFRCVEAAAQ